MDNKTVDNFSLIPSNNLDYYFKIANAVNSNQDEDSFCFSFKNSEAFIAVFDGCGGLGGRVYPNMNNYTGAYIASHALSTEMLIWYEEQNHFPSNTSNLGLQEVVFSLKQRIKSAYNALLLDSLSKSSLKGPMVRTFPTTLSAIWIDYSNSDRVRCLFLWAGDSRGFYLDPHGLVQCTIDDLKGSPDALDNLYSDAPLSNQIDADTDFKINTLISDIKTPSIVFCATDGIFGYLQSPMDFELLLLRTLSESKSPKDWQTILDETIKKISGDDNTLVLAVFGFGNFSNMKRLFEPRRDYLTFLLDSNMMTANKISGKEKLEEIWDDYKVAYYGKFRKSDS